MTDTAGSTERHSAPGSAAWDATLTWLQKDCGLDAAGTETLIRLAASIVDEKVRLQAKEPYRDALTSFGEPDEVEALAAAVAERLYGDDRVDTQTCRHCGRTIIEDDGRWVDPEATGDDSVWRETCDAHDTFTAEHEPDEGRTA